ncbi:hypothetical protein [Borrelia duttonii]|nr:hypothetical protein [Borrelia duttonii]
MSSFCIDLPFDCLFGSDLQELKIMNKKDILKNKFSKYSPSFKI